MTGSRHRGSLTLLERVGEGAFGEVYRAWDPSRAGGGAQVPRVARYRDATVSVAWSSTRDGCSRECAIRTWLRCMAPTPHRRTRGVWMEFVAAARSSTCSAANGRSARRRPRGRTGSVPRAAAVHAGGPRASRRQGAERHARKADGRIVLMDFGTGVARTKTAGAMSMPARPVSGAGAASRGDASRRRARSLQPRRAAVHLVTGGFPVGRDVARSHSFGAPARSPTVTAGCAAGPADPIRGCRRGAFPHLRRERPIRERRHDGARARRSPRRRG